MTDANAPPRIGFIGAGRLASALSRAFAHRDREVSAVFSRSQESARTFAVALPDCRAVPQAAQVLDLAELVFVTVPDDAIAPVASALPWRSTHFAVHCSGALGLEALGAAKGRGALTGAFHPLQLFSEAEAGPERLSGCAISVEADPGLREMLLTLVCDLGARPLQVPPGARAAYHAASHYAAAFVCVLLAEGEAIMRRVGIDGDAAAWGLHALARGTLDAVQSNGSARAMAGVYSRGDAGIAQQHVRALEAIGGDAVAFYRTLALRSVSLAAQAQRIDAQCAEKLRASLRA
jgi:predicted short-subunit dehydrogenase-like oxidoreductase (DUF2520 family)